MDSMQKRRRSVRLMTAALAVAMAGGLIMVRTARSADPAPAPSGNLNIAIANIQNIAENIKEFSDLKSEDDLDQKSLQSTLNDKKNAVEALKQSLTYLRPDSPQYTEQEQKVVEQEIQVKAWLDTTQLEMGRRDKMRLRALFQEIEDAVASVAQKDGYNLVLNDERQQIPDNMDNIDIPTLRQLILQRTVLFSDQSRSIDGEVITLLDKNYANRASGGPTTAPTTPAPRAMSAIAVEASTRRWRPAADSLPDSLIECRGLAFSGQDASVAHRDDLSPPGTAARGRDELPDVSRHRTAPQGGHATGSHRGARPVRVSRAWQQARSMLHERRLRSTRRS